MYEKRESPYRLAPGEALRILQDFTCAGSSGGPANSPLLPPDIPPAYRPNINSSFTRGHIV